MTASFEDSLAEGLLFVSGLETVCEPVHTQEFSDVTATESKAE
jgi:hypothetical protein